VAQRYHSRNITLVLGDDRIAVQQVILNSTATDAAATWQQKSHAP
jgi:hypothetical protein